MTMTVSVSVLELALVAVVLATAQLPVLMGLLMSPGTAAVRLLSSICPGNNVLTMSGTLAAPLQLIIAVRQGSRLSQSIKLVQSLERVQ